MAFAATLGFASADAAVIYNNGGPAGETGNETTQWVQAEDFSFGLAATVGGAGVYIGGTGGDLSSWDGTFDYFIFADSGGTPGGVLASGAAQNVVVSDTGIPWYSGNAWLVDFDFASNFAAAGGSTYWLGVHLSTNFDRDEIYWATTSLNATDSGLESNGGTFDNWSGNGQEHAFYLLGERTPDVPAPAALSLLGLGLAGLGMARRKK